MSVCLYNGHVYRVDFKEQLERKQLLLFFLAGHIKDVIVLYNNGKYIGCISYGSLLNASNFIESIIYDKLMLGDRFWKDAQSLLQNDKNICLPVFSRDMKIIYLVKYEITLVGLWQKLEEIKEFVDSNMLKKMGCFDKHIHIKGISDILWYFREWLIFLGVRVSVEGREWEDFGIETAQCENKKAIIVDINCHLLNDIHSKYREWISEDYLKLEKLFEEPKSDYVCGGGYEDREKILFYVPSFSYFIDSISPLIFRYLSDQKKECYILMPHLEAVVLKGQANIKKTIEIIRKIKVAGGKCYNWSVGIEKLLQNKYKVCYLCSEYSGGLPLELKNVIHCIVALQTTAIYVHMYRLENRFEEVFSEQAMKEVDYFVSTEFMANWINKREKNWNYKILRFGCPKLDTLYSVFRNGVEIPKKWKKRIVDKKVILFTTTEMEQKWLDYLITHDDVLAIWRPHPVLIAGVQKRTAIESLCEKYGIILDDNISYYESFYVSDAHVAYPLSSVTFNYLYFQKPICLYGSYENSRATVIDYRQEAWYKSSCCVEKVEEVLDFIEMVRCNPNNKKIYTDSINMLKDFDGKVCDRIYEFFEGI